MRESLWVTKKMLSQLRVLGLWLTIFALVAGNCVAAQAKRSKPEPAEMPMTIERFLVVLDNCPNVYSIRVVLARIHRPGLDFQVTPEKFELIKSHNPPPEILQAIKELMPAPAPVVAQKPPALLRVTCAPAECEVRIGTDVFRSTVAGVIDFPDIKEQRLILDAKKEGYDPRTEVVEVGITHLAPGEVTTHVMELSPSAATQSKWGAVILSGIIKTAGVPPPPWKLAGTLSVSPGGANAWSFEAELSTDMAAAKITVTDPNGAKASLNKCDPAGCMVERKVALFKKSPFSGSGPRRTAAEDKIINGIVSWLSVEYAAAITKVAAAQTSSRLPPEQARQLDAPPYSLQLDGASNVVAISAPRITVPGESIKASFTGSKKGVGGVYPEKTEFTVSGPIPFPVTVTVSDFSSTAKK